MDKVQCYEIFLLGLSWVGTLISMLLAESAAAAVSVLVRYAFAMTLTIPIFGRIFNWW